jgi:hypothetical protein
MKCLIYDFETLSTNMFNCVVVNIAAMNYTEERFTHDPYSYEELLDKCSVMKFDVKEQVEKYDRKIEQGTLNWWKKQSAEAQQCLKPSDKDVSITELYPFLIDKHDAPKCDKIFTRGNTFDPVLVRSIFDSIGIEKDPTPHWIIKDTRSYLDAFLWGSEYDNKFIPEEVKDKFIHHDPSHDIAMDVYRMQSVIQAIHG